ncbi:MAG: RNA polymerase sigma factor [bacterium]|nr:RNA polymerase sigma factor [bacterium]
MLNDDLQQRFMALFEPQRDALWRFIRSMVRSTHEAEDIMSETVLQAYQSFQKLRDEQAFVSFLFTIASRLNKRQRWRRSFFGEFDEDAAMARPHTDPLPDAQLDVLFLRKALQSLPIKQRESVVLFDVLGLSLEEVREVQGDTLSGVKSRLLRGRQTLARMLDADVSAAPSHAPLQANSSGPMQSTSSVPLQASPVTLSQTVTTTTIVT